ncbi:hypothetical protein K3495_g16253, partial [Podosphaera aphanis]
MEQFSPTSQEQQTSYQEASDEENSPKQIFPEKSLDEENSPKQISPEKSLDEENSPKQISPEKSLDEENSPEQTPNQNALGEENSPEQTSRQNAPDVENSTELKDIIPGQKTSNPSKVPKFAVSGLKKTNRQDYATKSKRRIIDEDFVPDDEIRNRKRRCNQPERLRYFTRSKRRRDFSDVSPEEEERYQKIARAFAARILDINQLDDKLEHSFPAGVIAGVRIPKTYAEAISDATYSKEWKAAMLQE